MLDRTREHLDNIASRARANRAPGEEPHLTIAYLAGALRYYSDSLADLLRDLADELSDVYLQRVMSGEHPSAKRKEVMERLMDVVHEEALQRNQWHDYQVAEEERLRGDVAAAAHGG